MMISTLMEYDVCLLHGTFPCIIELHVQYYIESLCAIEHIYENDKKCTFLAFYGVFHLSPAEALTPSVPPQFPSFTWGMARLPCEDKAKTSGKTWGGYGPVHGCENGRTHKTLPFETDIELLSWVAIRRCAQLAIFCARKRKNVINCRIVAGWPGTCNRFGADCNRSIRFCFYLSLSLSLSLPLSC